MRNRSFSAIVTCLAMAAGAIHASNTTVDRDGDGAPDYASVSDWDGDGTLEMVDDIQAAIDALTDDGPKLVEVEAGSYAPPAPGSGIILRLPSRIELAGRGAGVTILNGYGPGDLVSTSSVVSNANWESGNEGIVVRDLEIDGGWADGDASGLHHARAGLAFNRCTDCRVEHTTVRDTLHTCLYTKNGTGIRFENNTLLRCGNYEGTGGNTYPCVYLYANNGEVQQDVHVTGNLCDGSGASGLSTRRESAAAFLRDVHFTGNTVRNTRIEDGYAKHCIWVQGIDGGTYVDNVCDHTGSFEYASEAYYADGTSAEASRQIHVDGLWILDPVRSHGVQVHGFLEQASFRDVHVLRTDVDRDCMVYNNPLRDVRFLDLDLEDCGRMAIHESLPRGTGPGIEEGLAFRRVSIDGVDADRNDGVDRPAVLFRGPVHDLDFGEIDIHDVSGDGVKFLGDLHNSVLRDVEVSEAGGRGIVAGPDVLAEDLAIRDGRIDGAGASGIELSLSSSLPSSGIEIARNEIRDFGRACPGSFAAVGITVTGAADGLTIEENRIEDLLDQAQFGIVHDVQPVPDDLSHLCTNEFAGTLGLDQRYSIPGLDAPYRIDTDGDLSVDACDCAPADATRGPGAAEINDGIDNQCPGDRGHGVIDELSGTSGFHDPLDATVYSWPAQPGATGYRVVRSVEPDLSAECTAWTTDTPWIVDGAAPAAGLRFFYLPRATAPHSGSWGQDGAGAEREGVCP